MEQVKEQNLETYLKADCEVLHEAFLKYDGIITEKYGFSLIKNKIFTLASLAQKIKFSKYYKEDTYRMTSEME